MDPLCLAGSIVELIQLSAGILSSLKEIHNTTACDDVERLQQDLSELSSALHGFRTLIEVSDEWRKHHEQGHRISAGMREELQTLVQESHSTLDRLKRLVDQGKHKGHPGAIIWLRKLADIKHLTQKWDTSLLRIKLASNTPQPLIIRFCGVGGKGWRIHDETRFAIIDSKSSSDILLGREHIPEAAADVDAEAGPLEPHRRHEGDHQDRGIGVYSPNLCKRNRYVALSYCWGNPTPVITSTILQDVAPNFDDILQNRIMGVTGAGKSSSISAAQEEHESEATQFDSSGIRGFWARIILERIRFALQEKLPDRYGTSFDGFDGSSVPVRQIATLKSGSTYHLEAYSNLFLDEADVNLVLSLVSLIQPRDGGTPDSLRICDNRVERGMPALYKNILIGLKKTYPDTIHHPNKPSRKSVYLDRTMAAPAALISFFCALCMHNYDANRHDQPAGHLMRPMPIWSAIDNPSPPMFVAATMTHGIATLAYYALRPGDRFRESFLGIGLVSAGAVGYGIGADTESVLIGILPLVTTMSLLVCTLMNVLLKGCGVGSSFGERRERDLEKQSGK